MWWFIFSLFHSQKDIHSLTLSFSHTSHHSILLLLTMMMLRNKYIIWKCVSTIDMNKEKTYFVWFENIYCNAWPDFMSNMPYFQLKEINVTTLRFLVEVCCWAVSREHLTITFVVETLDQWELNSWIMELFDVVTSCFAGNNLFNLDDLKKKTTFISFKKYIGNLWNQWYLLGWHGHGHDDGMPCRSSIVLLHHRLSSHGTLCTCCEFQNENHISTRYRSSLLSMVSFRTYVSLKRFHQLPSWTYAIDAKSTRNETWQRCDQERKCSSWTMGELAPFRKATYARWFHILSTKTINRLISLHCY